MDMADHFDGCSFIYEDDRTTITNGHAVDIEGRTVPPPLKEHEARPSDQNENIRAWLSGIIVDDENRPLVSDVLHALGNLQNMNSTPEAKGWQPPGKQPQARTKVNVHTMGPGFIGRAPPFASSEFFANMVVVAILFLFAPGFTILAAGVFVTSRVAERWVGQDE